MSGYRAALTVGAIALGGGLLHQLPHMVAAGKRTVVEEVPKATPFGRAIPNLPHYEPSLSTLPSLPHRVELLPPIVQGDSKTAFAQSSHVSEIVATLDGIAPTTEGDSREWLDVIRRASAQRPLQNAISSDMPADGRQPMLLQAMKREPIVLVDGIPRDADGYSRVFGSANPSVAQERAIQIVHKNLDELVRRGSLRAAGPLLDDAFRSKEKTVVFIAHNVGGEVALPSGEKYSLKDLSRRCQVAQKFCIFLSCDAYKYVEETRTAARRRLSINEAADAVHLLTNLMDDTRLQLTYSDLANYIPAILLAAEIRTGGKKTAKFTIVTAAPSGAIWIAVEYQSST